MTNPYIVKVYGITTWRKHFGIVMEEITGGNLEDLLFNPQIVEIRWIFRLRLCAQIIEALDYLATTKQSSEQQEKKREIQHNDLKPQNVLLTNLAVVKLCDFSAAVMAATSNSCSFPRVRQYTPNYTAPEILINQRPSIKSDIYR